LKIIRQIKKICFYGSRKIVIVFIEHRHLTSPTDILIQSTSSNQNTLRSNLSILSHPCLVPSSNIFFWSSEKKIGYKFLTFSCILHPLLSKSSWFTAFTMYRFIASQEGLHYRVMFISTPFDLSQVKIPSSELSSHISTMSLPSFGARSQDSELLTSHSSSSLVEILSAWCVEDSSAKAAVLWVQVYCDNIQGTFKKKIRLRHWCRL